jgi:phosphoinositide-3-kinase regulatory subunit 4
MHDYVFSLSDSQFGPDNTIFNVFPIRNSNRISMAADADIKIDRLYNDFDTIAGFLGLKSSKLSSKSLIHLSNVFYTNFSPFCQYTPTFLITTITFQIIRKIVILTNIAGNCLHFIIIAANLIFISIICSVIRNCLYPTSKLRAMELLFALGVHTDDEKKLDRIIPYLVSLLVDPHPLVKVNALATITQLLILVKSVTIVDSRVINTNYRFFQSKSYI